MHSLSMHARRIVSYDTHDLRFSVGGFFLYRRSHAVSDANKHDSRKFRAERDADAFLQKARGKIGLYATMRTRVQRAAPAQCVDNWPAKGLAVRLAGFLPGTNLCRRNTATFIPPDEQSNPLARINARAICDSAKVSSTRGTRDEARRVCRHYRRVHC